jgi:hypothetical protein
MPVLHGCAENTLKIRTYLPIGNWYNHDYLSQRIYKHEEPDEGRLSRPVLWERRGEIPLRDPIISDFELLVLFQRHQLLLLIFNVL